MQDLYHQQLREPLTQRRQALQLPALRTFFLTMILAMRSSRRLCSLNSGFDLKNLTYIILIAPRLQAFQFNTHLGLGSR